MPAAYKREAAHLFVKEFVRSDMTLGLGTGELSSLVIEEIGKQIANGSLQNIRGVPASDVAATAAAFFGLPLHHSDLPTVDLAFDQADQLDPAASACILGVSCEPQQPQLLRALSMTQKKAKDFVLLVEQNNVVSRLGGTLPVLIDADNWEQTAEEVDDIVIGDAEVWRRAEPGTPSPNPRGGDHPYKTAEGHNILDLRYEDGLKLYGEPEAYHKIEDAILEVEGVVATGLLLGVASAAVVARPEGAAEVVRLERDPWAKAGLEQAGGAAA